MTEKYKFTVELAEVATIAYQNGFVTKKIQDFIDNNYLTEAQKRLTSDDTTKDKFAKAAMQLYNEMFMVVKYPRRVQKYLQKLGLESDEPYKILYRKKVDCPPKKYVFVTKVYEDDSVSYENFYGSGKSETVDDFIKEFEALYKGTGVELRGCDGPYTTESYTMYYYDKLYSVVKEEK